MTIYATPRLRMVQKSHDQKVPHRISRQPEGLRHLVFGPNLRSRWFRVGGGSGFKRFQALFETFPVWWNCYTVTLERVSEHCMESLNIII